MNITIQGRIITLDTNVLGYKLDNMIDSITLTILDKEGNLDTTTPVEQQWKFNMLLYMCLSNSYQTIEFNGTYPILTAPTLTSKQLPINGRYVGQFQMVLNEKIMHSQQFDFWVQDTLNIIN